MRIEVKTADLVREDDNYNERTIEVQDGSIMICRITVCCDLSTFKKLVTFVFDEVINK